MRTARLLPVSPSMHCTGGSGPGGVWSQGVPGLGEGVCSGGCLLPWGCLLGGVPAFGPGGGYPSMQWVRPPREQNSWHTLVKILPCPNFVAGGKNTLYLWQQRVKAHILIYYVAQKIAAGK